MRMSKLLVSSPLISEAVLVHAWCRVHTGWYRGLSNVPEWGSPLVHYREINRGQILRNNRGLFKMVLHREDCGLLGVHVIGTVAIEQIHIDQATLGLRSGLDCFSTTSFNSPTMAECYKVAALDAFNKLFA